VLRLRTCKALQHRGHPAPVYVHKPALAHAADLCYIYGVPTKHPVNVTSSIAALASDISLQDCLDMNEVCRDGTIRFICFLRKQAFNHSGADLTPETIELIQDINKLYHSFTPEERSGAYNNNQYVNNNKPASRVITADEVQAAVAPALTSKAVDELSMQVISQFKKDGKTSFNTKDFDEAFEALHTQNGSRRFCPTDVAIGSTRVPHWKTLTATSRARAKVAELVVYREQKRDWFIIFD